MSNLNRLETVEIDDVVSDEFSEVNVDKGPTKKQLAKIEEVYADVLVEAVEPTGSDEGLVGRDKVLFNQINKYIDNLRMTAVVSKITSGEYVSVRDSRDEDDGEVKELDCDFDSNVGLQLSRGRRMFDD